ncbi:MAG: hypothetical protein LWX07_12565 [Bacteroidetes bacterium]|nr:hypothetical protein [Bacteroidota bacterium]
MELRKRAESISKKSNKQEEQEFSAANYHELSRIKSLNYLDRTPAKKTAGRRQERIEQIKADKRFFLFIQNTRQKDGGQAPRADGTDKSG